MSSFEAEVLSRPLQLRLQGQLLHPRTDSLAAKHCVTQHALAEVLGLLFDLLYVREVVCEQKRAKVIVSLSKRRRAGLYRAFSESTARRAARSSSLAVPGLLYRGSFWDFLTCAVLILINSKQPKAEGTLSWGLQMYIRCYPHS